MSDDSFPGGAPDADPGGPLPPQSGVSSDGQAVTAPLARLSVVTGATDDQGQPYVGACAKRKGELSGVFMNITADVGQVTILNAPVGTIGSVAPLITIFDTTGDALASYDAVAPDYYDAAAQDSVNCNLLIDMSDTQFVEGSRYWIQFIVWVQCSADGSVRRLEGILLMDVIPLLYNG